MPATSLPARDHEKGKKVCSVNFPKHKIRSAACHLVPDHPHVDVATHDDEILKVDLRTCRTHKKEHAGGSRDASR